MSRAPTGRDTEAQCRLALNSCIEELLKLSRQALHEKVSLTCVPPFGGEPYPYGDLVPQGFILRALKANSSTVENDSIEVIRRALSDALDTQRQRGLWSYHTGGLVTSIDSGLVLLGLSDPAAVQLLEAFQDGHGRYYPQLWTRAKEVGKMTVNDAIRHWCQPDYSIACLLRYLRFEAGLSTSTPLSYLEEGFESRSGLFLANPYMVDWFLSLAITEDSAAENLRERLMSEVLSSVNEDYSFGTFDLPLSTALSLLTLIELNGPQDVISATRARLASLWLNIEEFPACLPFYSTHAAQWSQLPARELMTELFSDHRKQLIKVNNLGHAITFYEDAEKLIVTALVALALIESATTGIGKAQASLSECPDRYRCESPSEYIERFALVPYINSARYADV